MPVYEGVTVNEAIQKGLHALALTEDQVVIDVLTEGKKGFLGVGKKNAQVSIEPTLDEEISEAVDDIVSVVLEDSAEDNSDAQSNSSTENPSDILEATDDEQALNQLSLYLTNITKALNAPALVNISREESVIVFQLDTQKQGILIGKHGKTLNALQYLAQVFIHRAAKNKLSVVVNVGNYREKRQAILERLAEKTADKVKHTKRPVFLEPMPAFERKLIHSVLSKNESVQTHSEGEEPYRYLVVEPAKKQ